MAAPGRGHAAEQSSGTARIYLRMPSTSIGTEHHRHAYALSLSPPSAHERGPDYSSRTSWPANIGKSGFKGVAPRRVAAQRAPRLN